MRERKRASLGGSYFEAVLLILWPITSHHLGTTQIGGKYMEPASLRQEVTNNTQ